MSADNGRVGLRQWRVLLAAENAYPHDVTAYALRLAILDGLSWTHHRDVLASLTARKLLAHTCRGDVHPIRESCTFGITEWGAGARKDKKLRGRGRKGARIPVAA